MSRTFSALAGVVFGAVFVAGCGDVNATSAALGGTKLVGTQWVLDVSALGVSGAGSVSSWISFDRDRVSGNDGCNAFSGAYKRDGSDLTFGPLAGTQQACAGPAGEVSAKVSAALGHVRMYELAAERLRLKDASWTVISVLYDDAIRSVVGGTELTADFSAEGMISGHKGCNSFHGEYTLDGKRLNVGSLAATKKACPTIEAAAQEAGYLSALESAVTIEQVGPELTLLNAKGQMAVTLQRSDAEIAHPAQ
jgi:heat shock protein HslJ